jgi:hypothetical protein
MKKLFFLFGVSLAVLVFALAGCEQAANPDVMPGNGGAHSNPAGRNGSVRHKDSACHGNSGSADLLHPRRRGAG